MPKKILIIAPSWIGDCVMAQPMLRRLRELHPNCIIDVFAPKWSRAVFERMPEVAEILDNPFGHGALQLKKRWQIGRILGKRGYNQVIVLPGSLKSGIIAWATGIKQRTGYVGEGRYIMLNDVRKLDKTALSLMVDRYTALAYPTQADFPGTSPYPQLQTNKATQQATLNLFNLDTQRKIIAFCPGAEYGPSKRWPAQYVAQMALHYLTLGWQIWLFGTQKDLSIAEEINTLCQGACINLCGKTSLSQAIDLLACTDLVVCNDSGLMHLAAALNRKLVAVYGSTSPEHTPPLSDKAQIATLNLDCSPCFKRECPLGHTDCLNKLLPEQVIKLAEQK